MRLCAFPHRNTIEKAFVMKKTLRLCICLLLLLSVYSPKVLAQTSQKQIVSQKISIIQQERTSFLYGFYTAYMSSLVYGVDGLDRILREEYVSREVRKRKVDADILLDAQDCIEENLKTLNVVAIDKDWYKVSFEWPSFYPKVPARQHAILVKIGDGTKNYKIVDVKVEH